MRVITRSLLAILALTAFLSSAQAGEVINSGEFEGRSDHVTSGGVSILRTNGQTLLVLEAEFSLDGAPDPQIGFGKDGFQSDTLIAELHDKTGAQVYVIPAHINIADINEVYIWCGKFDIPLGVARLGS